MVRPRFASAALRYLSTSATVRQAIDASPRRELVRLVDGVQTPGRVLSADELSGREISDATPDAQAAVDCLWELLEELNLTNGKQKPPVRCFTSILDGGVMLNGYYRDGTVFIHDDLGGTASVVAGRDEIGRASCRERVCMLV